LKDRGFVSGSSFLSNWTFEMRPEDEIVCSVSWILLYRASISGYRAADFHRACDGLEKCVVIVKAENVASLLSAPPHLLVVGGPLSSRP
jgi:hypothetical protein